MNTLITKNSTVVDVHDIDPETGRDIERVGYSYQPASDEAVAELLAADPALEDGFTRSEWLWFRMPNGDLILGFFPQDEGYFAHEGERYL